MRKWEGETIRLSGRKGETAGNELVGPTELADDLRLYRDSRIDKKAKDGTNSNSEGDIEIDGGRACAGVAEEPSGARALKVSAVR